MRPKGSKNKKKEYVKIFDKTKEFDKALDLTKNVESIDVDYTNIYVPITALKTVSHRALERELVQWMNDFCIDKGDSIKDVSVTTDGRAFTAFISYWSEE